MGDRPRTSHGRGVTERPVFRRDQAPSKNDTTSVRRKLRRDRRILSKTQNLLEIRLTPRTSAELKRKAARRETCCSVTINLLELVRMVLTAWVMHELVGDRPESKGGPI